MKVATKRLLPLFLAIMFVFTQCIPFAVAEKNDGYLEIVDLKTEYHYREPFSAKLRYYAPDGTVYDDILAYECEVSGFNNLAELPEDQEVTIQYVDASVTCTVQAGYNRQDTGKYNWGLNEATGELVICGTGSMDTQAPWSEYADSIRTITIIGDIYSIPAGAFRKCTNVETINIEGQVRSIADYAFYECRNVKNIFIPSTVTKIYENSFCFNSEQNAQVYYLGPQPNWDTNFNGIESLKNANVYTDCDATSFFYIQHEYSLNEEFHCELELFEIHSLHINRDLITVQGFDSTVAGKQMVTISFGPFVETEIVNVIDPDMPESVIEDVRIENVKTEYYYGESFYAEVYATIDGCVQDIPIEECSIEGFDSTMPGTQTVIIRYGNYIYEYVVNVYSESDTTDISVSFDDRIGRLEISGRQIFHNSLMSFSEYDIWRDNVTSLVVRAEYIYEGAFRDFNALTSVTLVGEYGEILIGEGAFLNCGNLTELYLPLSVREIRNSAFEACHSLRNVYYEGNEYDWSLINIDGNGNEFLDMARKHYHSTEIPSIGNIVINCTQDQYFVGDRSFIVEVYEEFEDGNIVPISEDEYTVEGFDTSAPGRYTVTVTCRDNSQEFYIYVIPRDNLSWNYDPDMRELVIEGEGDMGNYDHWWDAGVGGYTSAPWGEYLSEVESIIIGDEVTSISEGAFICSTQLTSVHIGENVERIEAFSFESCTSLHDINIPDSVTFIGGGAFRECTSLHDINFGSGLIEISGGGNFYGCPVNTIVLPDSLTTLGVSAFQNCQSLNTIYIPLSVTHIEREAFYNCNNLNDVFYDGSISDWNNIYIGSRNDCLYAANIHYADEEPLPEPPTEPTPEPPTEPTPEPKPSIDVVFTVIKWEYFIGEDLLVDVAVSTADGECYRVEDYEVEGFDPYTPGKQSVTVSYEDYWYTFDVTVLEKDIVEPENSAKISVSTEECMPGNTVDVILSLSGNTGFSNLGLEIEYDTALKLIGVSENSAVDATFTPAETLDAYPYNISFDNINNSYYNGDLVTLTFEIPENTDAGDYFINVDFYKGRDGNYIDGEDVNYDEDENPLNLTYESGYITVYTHIPGDIDGDGDTDNKDGTYLLRYLAGWNIDGLNTDALDTTGDGKVTSKDGTRLLRYLARWDVDIY